MEQKHVLLSALSVGVGVGVGLGLVSSQTVSKWTGASVAEGVTGHQIEQELLRLVLDGKNTEVTFDDFPYYLRYDVFFRFYGHCCFDWTIFQNIVRIWWKGVLLTLMTLSEYCKTFPILTSIWNHNLFLFKIFSSLLNNFSCIFLSLFFFPPKQCSLLCIIVIKSKFFFLQFFYSWFKVSKGFSGFKIFVLIILVWV